MTWRARFRMWLEEKHLTQAQVGSRCRPAVTQGAVGHWLTGRNQITIDQFMDLCRAAGADPQTILFGTPSETHTLERIREVLEASQPLGDPDPKAGRRKALRRP